MQIFIDIDDLNQLPFYKALVDELNSRGHTLELTAPNNLKKALSEHGLTPNLVGYIFSLFGLFKDKSIILRSANLFNHIGSLNKKFDVAFSTGSNTVLFTCANFDIPIVLFLDDYKQNLHPLYKAYEKCSFILPANIPDQTLLEKGFDIQKTARYKGTISTKSKNPDLKSIKEIADKIEYLREHMPGGLVA